MQFLFNKTIIFSSAKATRPEKGLETGTVTVQKSVIMESALIAHLIGDFAENMLPSGKAVARMRLTHLENRNAP
jgi:hypothetical protein